MKQELKDAMDKAEMDAVMVVEAADDYETSEGINALRAIGKAEQSGNAVAAYNARIACEAWISKHEDRAMVIATKRIADRAEKAAAREEISWDKANQN